MRLAEKEQRKKFNKINKVIRLDKFLHNDKYNFDNGQVEEILDIVKENVKYSIMKVNTDIDTNEYLVFVIIQTNDKSATHQLLQEFNCINKTNEYFKTLENYITNTSNSDIIDKCYEELSSFPRKNFITKILGI